LSGMEVVKDLNMTPLGFFIFKYSLDLCGFGMVGGSWGVDNFRNLLLVTNP